MSRSNLDNASSDLPPSYDEVCSTAGSRGASPSTSRKTKSTSKSKNSEIAPEFTPTAPPQDILEDKQVPEPTRPQEHTIPITVIVDDTDCSATSSATRNKTYQQIPQGPELQNNRNNARFHQTLRRNLSYNSCDVGNCAKYTVYALSGIFLVVFLIVILMHTSYSNYNESEEYYKPKTQLDELFEVNDYVSGRRDMKKDFEELSARINSTLNSHL